MATPWHRDPDLAARSRVLCLPWAGAGTVDWRALGPRASAAGVDVLPLCLPGREGRMGEPAFRAMGPLVDALVPVVRGLADRPYTLVGHSMGAWVAAAVAARLVPAGVPAPTRLVLSGRRAPQVPDRLGPLHALPDSAFVAALQERYQAMPAQLLARPDVLALFLPTLRADFTVLETWSPPAPAPLPAPLTVLAGAADATVSDADLAAWSAWSAGPVAPRRLPGGHFFPKEPAGREALLDALLA